MSDDEVHKFLSKIGKKGGMKTKELGHAHYSAAGKKGMQKRWANKKKKETT